jgi:hypothetical protein
VTGSRFRASTRRAPRVGSTELSLSIPRSTVVGIGAEPKAFADNLAEAHDRVASCQARQAPPKILAQKFLRIDPGRSAAGTPIAGDARPPGPVAPGLRLALRFAALCILVRRMFLWFLTLLGLPRIGYSVLQVGGTMVEDPSCGSPVARV